MRKQLCLWGMIPLILLGLAACNKDDATPQDQGTGEVKIAFGFDKATESKAPVGETKRPVTSWKESVKDLMILFVANDKVLDARTITVPKLSDISQQSTTLDKVPVMTNGDIYLVANSGVTDGILRKSKTGGFWSPATVKNQTFSKLYLGLVAVATSSPEEIPNETKYTQPAEIFLAHQANVSIEADKTTTSDPLHLTRAVSLIRVRLNPVGANDSKISFTDAKALVYLRKVNPELTLAGAASGHTQMTGIIVPKPFLATEPLPADYKGNDNILDAVNGIKYYQDIMSLPGGGSGSADKFEVVIKGITTTADYVLPDGTKLALGEPVYWSGAFDMVAAANGIVILTVTVNSQGVIEPPKPGNYGSLTVNVDIADWGSVESGVIQV